MSVSRFLERVGPEKHIHCDSLGFIASGLKEFIHLSQGFFKDAVITSGDPHEQKLPKDITKIACTEVGAKLHTAYLKVPAVFHRRHVLASDTMPWECAAQRWVEVDWCDWSQLSGAPRKNPLNRIQSTRKLQSNYLDWAHFMMCFAKFMFQKAVRVRFVEFANLQAWKIIDTLSWIQTKMRKRNEDHRFTKIHNPKIAPPKKKIEKNCAMAYMALVPPLPSNGRKWRCLQRSPSNTKIQVVMTTDLDDLAEGIFRGTQTHGSQPCLWLQDQGNKGIDQGLVEIMGQDEWFPGDFFGIRISCVIPKCSAQTTINHIQSSISRCPGEKIWQSCAQTTGFFSCLMVVPQFQQSTHQSDHISLRQFFSIGPPRQFIANCILGWNYCFKHSKQGWNTLVYLWLQLIRWWNLQSIMKTNFLKSHGKKTRIITDHMQRVCRNSTIWPC